MKKVLVLFVVGVVFFGACSAQNANAQNANIAQRIIGTWVQNTSYGTGDTWVFNANGTLTIGTNEYKYGVADTYLAFYGYNGYSISLYNVSISSDGKTLILALGNSADGMWLTKR